MITHIVVWKLKDSADGYTKSENAERIKIEILNLKSKIPQIKKIEAGINILPADDGFDLVLYSEFENKEDLAVYQDHPEHIKFKNFIQDLKSDKRFIDYIV